MELAVRGRLRLSAIVTGLVLLPQSGALAQSFTVESGATIPNIIMATPGDTGTVLAGGMIVGPLNGLDALTMSGDNQQFFNRAGGRVSQSGDSGAAIFSDGFNALIANAGEISASGVNASYGIVALGDSAVINNSGLVETSGLASIGVLVSGGAGSFVQNTGSIRSTGNAGFGVILDGPDSVLLNRGTIETTGPTSSAILVGPLGMGTVITSDGRIISPLDGTSNAVLIGADNVTLNIRAGSVIQGGMIFNGLNGTLDIGNGLNTALTYDSLNSVTVNANGMPFASDGSGLLAVVDTSGFAAHDEILADLTGNLAGVAEDRLRSGRRGAESPAVAMDGMVIAAAADFSPRMESEFWLKLISGYRDEDDESPEVGFDTRFGGLVMGVDGETGFASRAGLFGGAALGRTETATSSQEIDHTAVFAGAYASLEGPDAFLDFTTTVGFAELDSQRRIANNLVQGGIEHADASYHGVFASPSATIGTEMTAGTLTFIPSLRARYAALFLDGYAEDGSSANLDVERRTVQVFELRGQVAMALAPREYFGIDTQHAIRLGLDGTLGGGEAIDATLLGQSLTFNSGSDDWNLRGFAALDSRYDLPNGWQLVSSTELGALGDGGFTLQGRVGLDIPL
jgi:uncharacterized protein with beta-barrel porin domain